MSDRKSLAKPPRLAAWILERLFADREMHSTLGDMEEIFHAEVEAGGRRRARFWYWHQLLKALPHRLLAVFLLDIPMFVLSLKIMIRSMARHKLFMALTLLALTLGLTCFFLIFLYSRYESTYDSFHPDSGRIYRLILDDRPGGQRDGTPGPSSGALESSIPEVEATAQTCRGFDPIIKIGKEKFQATGLFVGEEFLRLFRFPLRRGSERSLSEPGRVVLTEQAARRLFGREDPLGRTLDFRIRDEGCLLTVSGIVADPPANTHFQFELLISYPTARSLAGYRNLLDRSNNRFPRTYVKLRRRASARAAAEKIAAFLGSGAAPGSRLRATLQPLADVHLRPDGKNADAVRSLTLLIFLSILILVVAVINYVNLATSRSSLRRREIGIRKTVGAQRRQLIRQFLGEAVVLTAVSFALAVAALLALLPAFNRTMERNLRLEQLFRGTNGLEIVGILLLVGVVAGIYPALCLSSFQPARILKGAEARAAGSSRPRNLLLVVQFTAAVVLVVLTLFIRGQIRFIRDRDPGFDKSRIVEAWAFPPDGILAKRRLLENPKVAGVTLASNVISLSNRDPLDEMGEKIEVLRDSAWEPLTGGIFVLACDHDFVPVFHLRLLAGRNFSGTRDESSSAIINETLARRLGPGDPVGKTVRIRNRDLTVIGILGDFNIQPLHASIGPVLLTHTNDNYGLLYARFGAGVADEALSIVEKAIDEFIPDEKNSAVFLEDRLSALYKAEHKQAALMSFFATLSVIIAGLSVFGLAGFAVERRTREIGIRKVLGARTGRLFLLLSGNFTVLLGVANALGWPLAFYFANRWLSNFAYHVPVRPGTFLLTAAGMMGVMLLASGTQIFKISRIDPVEILKYE